MRTRSGFCSILPVRMPSDLEADDALARLDACVEGLDGMRRKFARDPNLRMPTVLP